MYTKISKEHILENYKKESEQIIGEMRTLVQRAQVKVDHQKQTQILKKLEHLISYD